MVPTQPTLPGFGLERRPARAARRGRAPDPAETAARAQADARFSEWRGAFAAFVRALPTERRDELRRKLRAPAGRG